VVLKGLPKIISIIRNPILRIGKSGCLFTVLIWNYGTDVRSKISLVHDAGNTQETETKIYLLVMKKKK
jgi:hypothetical protein